MILRCSFEELRALASGAELLLSAGSGNGGGVLLAPSEALAHVAILRDSLDAPLAVQTLSELRLLEDTVALICEHLRQRLEGTVLEFHPAHEDAVHLYFDYGHTLGLLRRIEETGSEMETMIELMTGSPVNDDTARTFTFPD